MHLPPKAIRKELTSFREGERYNLHPTLFYIFGKAVKDESKKYVKTDDDADTDY